MERRCRDSFSRLTGPSDANSIILDKLPTSGSRSSFDRNSSQGYISRTSSRLSRSEDAIIQQPPQFDNEEQGDKEGYPSLWKLVLITIGLCLCVFCVALVHLLALPDAERTFNIFSRITQSSLRQFPRSPTSSSHSKTWDGTEAPIF